MTQLSPVTSPPTPMSPPSEMSAPLSSLAMSVPSVGLSPSGEEERPLLLSKTHQTHKSSSRDEQKRNSAHYNHGHVANSLPPSPLFTMEDVDYEVTSDHDATDNNISECNTETPLVPNGHTLHHGESVDSVVDVMEVPQEEHIPFFATEGAEALLHRATDSSRTNPALSNSQCDVYGVHQQS